jgi:hypothetical protein
MSFLTLSSLRKVKEHLNHLNAAWNNVVEDILSEIKLRLSRFIQNKNFIPIISCYIVSRVESQKVKEIQIKINYLVIVIQTT